LTRASDEEAIVYPGARAPERTRAVDSHGVRLVVYEWGEPHAPALLLAHGALDFARTFNVFAPLLADAGYRVVSWDQRGHGDSQHAELYGGAADRRDLLMVADSLGPQPHAAIGHSRGGALLVDVAYARPQRFAQVVVMDGLPSRPSTEFTERERSLIGQGEVARWLDRRRRLGGRQRKPGTLEELAARRARHNPRLSRDWLRYLVQQGARRDADGWRWKIDPALGMGGFGPRRLRSGIERLPGFPVPLLALLCGRAEPMGWGTRREHLEHHLPHDARLEVMEDAGHFMHIEWPRETADLVLAFLRS
jgi:pimeloyl-ACP methyl ester carboxylesterase